MPAALGLHLILDVHGARPGCDQRSHRARDVERAPESRVGVDEQRQRGDAGDATYVRENVVQRRDPEIGQSEGARGDAAARQIDGLEADALRHPRGVGVDAADDLQRPLGGDRRAEARAGGRAHAHDHTTGGDGLPGGAGLGPTARLDSPG